jgi:hypothetical protein
MRVKPTHRWNIVGASCFLVKERYMSSQVID